MAVYSPKEVNISVYGQNISGWDSITISRNSENATTVISADGIPRQAYSADSTGTAEIEVQQQNSPVNALFSAIQKAQDIEQTLVYFPVTVEDKSGGVFVTMAQAFLNNPANMDLATEQTSRTWMIYVNDLQYLPNPAGTEDLVGVATAEAIYSDIISKLTG